MTLKTVLPAATGRRLLTDVPGPKSRELPPLVITDDQLDDALTVLENAERSLEDANR